MANLIVALLKNKTNIANYIIADENPLFLFYLKSKNPTIRKLLEGFDGSKI